MNRDWNISWAKVIELELKNHYFRRFLSEGELIEQQIVEQQHAQLAQQGTGSSTVISAGHLSSAGEVAGSPQRNYYMWKDSLQQPQQPGN